MKTTSRIKFLRSNNKTIIYYEDWRLIKKDIQSGVIDNWLMRIIKKIEKTYQSLDGSQFINKQIPSDFEENALAALKKEPTLKEVTKTIENGWKTLPPEVDAFGELFEDQLSKQGIQRLPDGPMTMRSVKLKKVNAFYLEFSIPDIYTATFDIFREEIYQPKIQLNKAGLKRLKKAVEYYQRIPEECFKFTAGYKKLHNQYYKRINSYIEKKGLIDDRKTVYSLTNLKDEPILAFKSEEQQLGYVLDGEITEIKATQPDEYAKWIDFYKCRYQNLFLNFKDTLDEFIDHPRKELLDPDTRAVLELIKDRPQRGITTIVDVLKGSQSRHMREGDYCSHPSYGALEHYNSDCIHRLVSSLVGMIGTEYISPRNYDPYKAYYVTEQVLLQMKVNPLTDDNHLQTMTLREATNKFRNYKTVNEKILNRYAIIMPENDQMEQVLQFIKETPCMVKDEPVFLQYMARRIPDKWLPLIEMNEKIETGKEARRFKLLAKAMKGKQAKSEC
jgi:hypothetical protein